MKLKNFFLMIRAYISTYKNFYNENTEKINQLNISSLNTLNIVAVFIFGALFINVKLTNDFLGLSSAYFIYFIIFLTLNIIFRYMQHNDHIIHNYFLYLVIALIYIFGIYIGCIKTNNLVSVMFPVFLICLPMVFILPPIEINLFNIIFIVAFLWFSKKYKLDALAFVDQTNILACFFISAFTSYTINRARIKEFSLSQKLENICNTDELTNLHNRRSFNNFIVTIFDQTPPENLTLMMIDIDNFKDYNDSYGHICGDNCLVTIGEIFKEFETTYGCYIARYGGEEFVLVDNKHTLTETVSIVNELMRIISDSNIEHFKSSYKKITLSIGISSKAMTGVSNYIDLINLSDSALYQAKSNGKNTFMVAAH